MPRITVTLDKDDLIDRVGNLGLAYTAIFDTGLAEDDITAITESLDEAFVDALLTTGDEPWVEGYIIVGPEPLTRDARRILFPSVSEAEAHLDMNATKHTRHKYEIVPLTRA